MYFLAWIFSIITVNNQLDAVRPSPLLISAGMAYVFWGIGWGISRVADMVYSVL